MAAHSRVRSSTQILNQFGSDAEDMAAIEAARPIQAVCMLWGMPGIGTTTVSPHASKLLR
jgi:8-hydroxy-5-deazaflavin:NADPH oxidoreductase